MNNRVVPVTFDEFLLLLGVAQAVHKSSNEPIPNLWPDNQARVKACLSAPFHTFDGKLLLRGFIDKAVALFYTMIKSHSLENGNKRMAVLVVGFFCLKNGRWLDASDKELYELATKTAMSTDEHKAKKYLKKEFITLII